MNLPLRKLSTITAIQVSLSVAGINDNDLSSDCDFDVTQKITRKRKKRSVLSTIAKHNIHSKGTSNNYETHPITWDQLYTT